MKPDAATSALFRRPFSTKPDRQSGRFDNLEPLSRLMGVRRESMKRNVAFERFQAQLYARNLQNFSILNEAGTIGELIVERSGCVVCLMS